MSKLRVVYGADIYIARWIAEQLSWPCVDPTTLNAFGVLDGETVIGGTVFHNHRPDEGVVEMSSACIDSRWLTRSMIRAIFNYGFGVLGCQALVMRVSAINMQMLNIAERFGFNGYLIPRLRGKHEDEWIFTYTDDQWLSSRFNRRPS